jgi:TonB-dependent SusC/RagA subfamily outer membrane receptor
MKKIFTLLTLLVSSIPIAFAQDPIKGVVKDDTGSPVPGATVVIKGTSNFAVTNNDGEFVLASAQQYPFSIQFNLVGYKQEEVEVHEPLEDAVEIVLKSDQLLDEVVVVGYGIQKKEDITGSVGSVTSQLLEQPVSSLDRGLQGAVSGVQVTTTSGQPGGGVSIRVRGGSSITGGNEPLYVIDGFPVTATTSAAGTITGAEVNPLSSLNPSDIASIDVLKDASATAIYGSRGANGVVIITTKKGQNGKSSITYDGSVGVQSLRKMRSNLPSCATTRYTIQIRPKDRFSICHRKISIRWEMVPIGKTKRFVTQRSAIIRSHFQVELKRHSIIYPVTISSRMASFGILILSASVAG